MGTGNKAKCMILPGDKSTADLQDNLCSDHQIPRRNSGVRWSPKAWTSWCYHHLNTEMKALQSEKEEDLEEKQMCPPNSGMWAVAVASYRVTGSSGHLTSLTKSTVHGDQQGLLACNYPQSPKTPKVCHHYCSSLEENGPQHLKKDYSPMGCVLLKAKWNWNSVISAVLFSMTDYLVFDLGACNQDMKPWASHYSSIYGTSTQVICDPFKLKLEEIGNDLSYGRGELGFKFLPPMFKNWQDGIIWLGN